MKKQIIFIIVSCIVIIGVVYYNLNKPFGKPIKITFEVIDDLGHPVSEANIRGYLNDPRQNDDAGKSYNVNTEADGTHKIFGMGYSFTECTITKAGYYSSRYHLKLKENGEFVRKLTVVLKKVRHPIAMQARNANITFPGFEAYYPFDLEIFDWVEPYGKGQKANIYIYYYYKTSDMFTGKTILRIKSEDRYTGLQIAELDEYSKFESMYFALTNNYTNLIEFVVDRNKTKVFKNTRLKENQYLIFKVQNSTNSTMYNYGKIYQPLEYGRDRDSNTYGLEFIYYYNPVPDDRNLEFDPKKNLIKTVDFRGKDNSDRFKP
jgi:predicted transcriptional regulator YdeE